jgi:hypothetical protein
MKKTNNIISDWLEKHGDPEIENKIEKLLQKETELINNGLKFRPMEIKKGNLTKYNNKWFIEYKTEPAGENHWYACIPIYELINDSENMVDLKLSNKYGKPVSELDGLEVDWKELYINADYYATIL